MKKIITFSLVLFVGIVCYGQQKEGSELYFNWNLGAPVSNSFVKGFNGSGANLGYNKFIQKNLSVGAAIGWNNYNTYYDRQTYSNKTGAITTDMYTYIFALPVTLTATKYFDLGKIVSPYIKIGAGAMYSEQNQYYNIYQDGNNNWGFTAIPEIGARFDLVPGSKWSLNASAQYLYATNKASDYGLKNLKTLSANIGASWRFH
ncbi:outer membrane beta-barrel protein [Flavitalea sp.]|nr:outer membrane beta-barrel protein [Flavitalea sp.]